VSKSNVIVEMRSSPRARRERTEIIRPIAQPPPNPLDQRRRRQGRDGISRSGWHNARRFCAAAKNAPAANFDRSVTCRTGVAGPTYANTAQLKFTIHPTIKGAIRP
jgi:hypothetical protein